MKNIDDLLKNNKKDAPAAPSNEFLKIQEKIEKKDGLLISVFRPAVFIPVMAMFLILFISIPSLTKKSQRGGSALESYVIEQYSVIYEEESFEINFYDDLL